MKSITRGRTGAMSTMNVIIVVLLVVILVGFTVLVALYGFVDPEDRFDDPVIEGDKGIGTIFTYEIVDEEITVEMEIIGESGSYYFVDVSDIATLVGIGMNWQMFHKETGLLRFGEEGEEIEVEIDGEDATLLESFVTGEMGDVWMFAASGEDGIPYIIEVELGDVTVRAELVEITIVEPTGEYERSDALDEYYIYSLVTTLDDEEISVSTAYYRVVAVCNGGFGLLELIVTVEEDEDGEEVEILIVGYELQDMTMTEYIFESTTDGLRKMRDRELETMDGVLTCDVYHGDLFDDGLPGITLEMTTYANAEISLVYLVNMVYDGMEPEMEMNMTLEEYSLPA